MNDRQDPYGQIYGYDEYGRPLYQPAPGSPGQQQEPQQEQYYPQQYQQPQQDQSGYQQADYQQSGYQQSGYPSSDYQQPGYGYDPYQQQYPGYGGYQQDSYDWGSGQQPRVTDEPGYPAYGTGEQPAVDAALAGAVPQQRQPETGAGADPEPEPSPGADGGPEPRAGGDDRAGDDGAEAKEYATEQFAFIEEEDAGSEDVIGALR